MLLSRCNPQAHKEGDPMERSQDLLDAYTRLFDDLSRGRVPSVDEYVSDSPAVSAIGSDPEEWWMGPETMRQVVAAQLEALASQGAQFIPAGPEAWAEGDLGWVVDRPTIRLGDGKEVELRGTTIFHREHGAWKMIHQHASIGVPNDQVEAFRGVG